LIKECKIVEKGDITDDCRWGKCSQCGVCDFENVRPQVFETDKKKGILKASEKRSDEFFKRLKIIYSKMNEARFFGHLEMVKIIIRAVNRAGIAVKYSKGFHPMPQISFEDPLPIGTESLDEKLYLSVPGHVNIDKLIKAVNAELPEGLMFKDCKVESRKAKGNQNEIIDYLINSKDDIFKKNALDRFSSEESVIITKSSKKGKLKKINLKDIVVRIDTENPDRLMLKIKKITGKSARPGEIIKKIFNLSETDVKRARILKLSSKCFLSGGIEKTLNV